MRCRLTRFRHLTLTVGLGLACGSVGCGGGVPLLYPARTLAAGDVRASGGTSGSFVVGSLANDVSAARTDMARGPVVPGSPGADPTYAKGALVLAAVAPGMAPYVSGRVGLGGRFEGGVTYTGRVAHVDARRSFDWNDVSLSVGFGMEVPIYGDPDTTTLPQIDLSSIRGFGADVPVLIGWQSAARVYMVWGGVRAGWDHTNVGAAAAAEPRSPDIDAPLTLSCDRFYGAGVVGLAAGFRHVHVALELDVAYQTVSGTFNATPVTLQGLSMAPATALWWTF